MLNKLYLLLCSLKQMCGFLLSGLQHLVKWILRNAIPKIKKSNKCSIKIDNNNISATKEYLLFLNANFRMTMMTKNCLHADLSELHYTFFMRK